MSYFKFSLNFLSVRRSFSLLALSGISAVCIADDPTQNFPSSDSNSALYYQMGGGQSVPMPAVSDTESLPIGVDGSIGTGFSCGKFNPTATITNSLNDASSGVENISQSIMGNATSAITGFPMYKLAQADPKLYDILSNNIVGAHNQYDLNMKSCEQMQSEALQGNDPYNNWISVSRNDDMKSIMSAGDNGGDLNEATTKVNQDQGTYGVPWDKPGFSEGASAGGLNQPPIEVIHDTAFAGYNVELGRGLTEKSAPTEDPNNQNLVIYWKTPEDAAQWIVGVVGDQKVTTCEGDGCDKGSTPGMGLLPDVQIQTTKVTQELSNLVANPDQVTAQNLLDVSAPGQVVSPALLQDIRQMNPNAQANTIATLGQNIATTQVVNEALLAIDILQMGSEVPDIHAVGPAQQEISDKIALMQSDIDHIMYSVKIRRDLNANVMGQIMQYNQDQNNEAAATPGVSKTPASMSHGAILENQENPA